MFMDIRDVMVNETHAGLPSFEHGFDEGISGFAAVDL